MTLRCVGRILRFVLAFVLTVTPAVLRAHGALKASTPARNAQLSQVPAVLRLSFTERVELSVARVILVRDGRDTVRLADLQSDSGGRVLVATLIDATETASANGATGRYVIHWLITGEDGHPVRGTIPFAVVSTATAIEHADRGDTTGLSAVGGQGTEGTTPSVPVSDTASPQGVNAGGVFAADGALQTMSRWLGFLAFFLLLGTVTSLVFVTPSLERQGRGTFAQTIKTRALLVGLLAGIAFLCMEVGRLILQHRALADADSTISYGALLGTTTWGTAWLVRNQAVIGALLALLLARNAKGAWYRVALGIAALAVFGVAAGMSLSGHAAGVVPRTPAVLYDMLHALSASAWIGTLAILLLVVLPLLRSDAATALIAVRSFSFVALGSVAVMIITGLLSAVNHLGAWSAIVNSNYGRVLLVKLAVITAVMGIGARNQLRLRNDRVAASERVSSIQRFGRVELLAAVLVLLVTAVLVATPTPPTATH